MNSLPSDYSFPKSASLFYFKGLYKDIGPKAFYQFFNRPFLRLYTRRLISKYAPDGIGLEVGVGARTVAPVKRTILSDGYHAHGIHDSIAKVFFKADQIPYDSETFSFILSEHMLEHATNPIKVLKEWSRVLKEGGKIFLCLPHRDRGSDRYRECTTLAHLIEDYENDVGDDDRTHVAEWVENVVDRGLMPDHYKHLSPDDWVKTGSVHHNVWTDKEIIELFEWLGMKVVFSTDRLYDRRDSIFVVAEKI